MATESLDATGLKCPLPVLKAQKRLKGMSPGDVLEVSATDPGAPMDLRALCDSRGHRILEETEADGTFTIRIERA